MTNSETFKLLTDDVNYELRQVCKFYNCTMTSSKDVMVMCVERFCKTLGKYNEMRCPFSIAWPEGERCPCITLPGDLQKFGHCKNAFFFKPGVVQNE